MQIPFWLFLSSLFFAFTLPDMASLLLKRGGGASSMLRGYIKTAQIPLFSSFFPSPNINKTHSSSFSTSTANMSAAYLEAVSKRRTIYQLEKKSPISDKKIQEIITEIVKATPSSFNSQSERVVLLVGKEHDKLWEIAKEVLKGIVPADAYASTEQRLNGFQAAYATVLFFIDRPSVQAMQTAYAIYADRFPEWAVHSDGAHQIDLWTALEAEGLGANLQHYNPLIDEKVRATWGISPEWELKAQLVIGTPKAGVDQPGEKTFKPVEGERFLSFGV